jgi:hypothetical protein
MKRFSIALAALLVIPVASWGEDVGFNNFGAASICLRSIAYRAGCSIARDEDCMGVWSASLRFCRVYMTTDKRTYRAALANWRFMTFVEKENRWQHRECYFSAWIGRMDEDARKKLVGVKSEVKPPAKMTTGPRP